MTMKTLFLKPISNQDRSWYLIDASGKTLGRLATEIAKYLKGKNKASFTPHIDNGDYVIVTNIDKIKTTGRKEEAKYYFTHSGYIGHLKATPLGKMKTKKPYEPLKLAVSGMLPKNKHRKAMLSRLKQYIGDQHDHEAQKPITIEL